MTYNLPRSTWQANLIANAKAMHKSALCRFHASALLPRKGSTAITAFPDQQHIASSQASRSRTWQPVHRKPKELLTSAPSQPPAPSDVAQHPQLPQQEQHQDNEVKSQPRRSGSRSPQSKDLKQSTASHIHRLNNLGRNTGSTNTSIRSIRKNANRAVILAGTGREGAPRGSAGSASGVGGDLPTAQECEDFDGLW